MRYHHLNLFDWVGWGVYFCSYRSKEGFLTLTRLLTSLSLASMRATFDLTELYLKVIDCLTTSSELAMKSAESSSMNLYSMFWIKSNLADPSLFIMNTAKKLIIINYHFIYLWGSLIQEFTIFIRILGYSWNSIMSFWPSCICLKVSSSTMWV